MICKNCGNQVVDGINFCTFCGAELNPTTSKVCTRCKSENTPASESCKKCGNLLKEEGKDYLVVKAGAVSIEPPVEQDSLTRQPPVQSPGMQQAPQPQSGTPTLSPTSELVPEEPRVAPAPQTPPVASPASPGGGVASPVSTGIQQQSGVGAAASVFCDVCGARNESDKVVCIHCQSPLKKPVFSATKDTGRVQAPEPSVAPAKSAPPVPSSPIGDEQAPPSSGSASMPDMPSDNKVCPKCGTENPAIMVICYSCGHMFGGEGSSSTAETASRQGELTVGASAAPVSSPILPPVPGGNSGTPAPEKTSADRGFGSIKTLICPKCKTPNLTGASRCQNCGITLGAEKISSDTKTQPFIVCPKCFFRNQPDVSDCQKCGQQLRLLPRNMLGHDAGAGLPNIGGTKRKCPVCGVDNPSELLSCKNCNYNFLKGKQEVLKVKPPEIPPERQVRCNRCDTVNDIQTDVCKVCGEKLDKSIKAKRTQPEYEQTHPMKKCPSCGVANLPTQRICYHCGSALDAKEKGEASAHISQQKPHEPVPPPANIKASPSPRSASPEDQTVDIEPISLESVAPDVPLPVEQLPDPAGTTPSPIMSAETVSPAVSMEGAVKEGVAPPPVALGTPAVQNFEKDSADYVPEWEKKPAKKTKDSKSNSADFSAESKNGTSSKRNITFVISSVIFLSVIFVVLFVIGLGGSEDNANETDYTPMGAEKNLKVEDISPENAETGSGQRSDLIPSLQDVTAEASGNGENKKGTETLTPEDQLMDLVSKGEEALRKNNITRPRENNAVYYFKQARELGVESSELSSFKSRLNSKLHSLGDSRLKSRNFQGAIEFYRLANQIYPEDSSVDRKIRQTRDMEKRDRAEKSELDAAVRSESVSEIEKFITKNPNSYYVPQARNALRRLRKKQEDAKIARKEREQQAAARRDWLNKQYTFNVLNKYFLGQERGTLTITRQRIIFQPVDDRTKRFSVTYDQIASFTFEEDEIILRFKQEIPNVGDEITFEDISGQAAKTRKMLAAYSELRPKK